MARIILSWSDVEALVEHLLPQFFGHFDLLLMVARGGIIPGGMIAEQLNISHLLTATVSFPAEEHQTASLPLSDRPHPGNRSTVSQAAPPSLGLPQFLQFPPDKLLTGKRILIVNHVWNHGRAINAVAGRVAAAGASPALCVLHYKPTSSLFPRQKPDFYAAITSDYIIYPWQVMPRLEPYRPMPEPR